MWDCVFRVQFDFQPHKESSSTQVEITQGVPSALKWFAKETKKKKQPYDLIAEHAVIS